MKEIVRENLDVIAQKLGLQPKRFHSKEEAIDANIKDFLQADVLDGGILDLPQEEKKDQLPTGN